MKSHSATVTPVNTRHYGMDALRILSVFMVLSIHILGFGGIIRAENSNRIGHILLWLLDGLCLCTANCYALISGYVMVNGKYRYTNLILLWLQVVLFNVLGPLVIYLATPQKLNLSYLLLCLFPVTQKFFWYFTAYFALFFLIPLLNRGINSLSRSQAKGLCCGILAVFSVLNTLSNSNPFSLNTGYSALWLALLYVLGGCIRKFDFGAKLRSSLLISGYIFSALVSVGFMFIVQVDTFSFLTKYLSADTLLQFTAPTMIFNAVALLLLFSRMRITRPWIIRLITLLSPVTFGVYILHCQPKVAAVLFQSELFAHIAALPFPLTILAVLGSAVVLFVLFGAIDRLRLMLFDALKLKKRLLTLEEKYIGDLWAIKEKKE